MSATREYANVERAVERRRWSPVGQIFDGEFVVHAYSIISTDLVVLDVWESYDGHSCQRTSEEYGKLGALRSRKLDAEIDALEYGPYRTQCVDQWYVERDDECEEIIKAAFPEIADRIRFGGMGQGRIDLDEFNAKVGA